MPKVTVLRGSRPRRSSGRSSSAPPSGRDGARRRRAARPGAAVGAQHAGHCLHRLGADRDALDDQLGQLVDHRLGLLDGGLLALQGQLVAPQIDARAGALGQLRQHRVMVAPELRREVVPDRQFESCHVAFRRRSWIRHHRRCSPTVGFERDPTPHGHPPGPPRVRCTRPITRPMSRIVVGARSRRSRRPPARPGRPRDIGRRQILVDQGMSASSGRRAPPARAPVGLGRLHPLLALPPQHRLASASENSPPAGPSRPSAAPIEQPQPVQRGAGRPSWRRAARPGCDRRRSSAHRSDHQVASSRAATAGASSPGRPPGTRNGV